ncbi:hypothetical protein O0L34_g3864 [Tuta absoluta]|nr:hypothetical protein O0L34_g3864 [Tuta absoluta]
MNLGLETTRKNSETQRSPSFPELERIDMDFGYRSSRRDSRTPSLPDMNELDQPGPSGMPTARNVCTPLPEDNTQKSYQPGSSRVQYAEYICTPMKAQKPEEVTYQPGPSISQTEEEKETPSKFLNEISPIPLKTYQVRKRAKQVATILTSEEHINYRKEYDEKKN